MSLTLKNAALNAGRVVLFVLMWMIATLGVGIIVTIFFATASFPFVGFGMMSSGETPTLALYAAWGLATLLAARFALAITMFTSHKDNARLDNDAEYVAYAIMWMGSTILCMAVATTFILAIYGYVYDVKPEGGNYEVAMQDTRYFLLAALIASGIFSAVGLKKDR